MNNNYLKDFSKRIEHIGLYATLLKNLNSKTIWDKYYMEDYSKQINLLFSLLVFIMDKSLRDEFCFKDDMLEFIHQSHYELTKQSLTVEEENELYILLVKDILQNGGMPMYLEGYNYENNCYEKTTFKFIEDEKVEVNGKSRSRYWLSEQGYNLLLSTKEIESNMKLNVQELIFNLHMEKMNYGEALEDVKNMYSIIRSQLSKIDDATQEIKRNVLSYGYERYQSLIQENNDTKDEMHKRLVAHKDKTQKQISDLEHQELLLEEDVREKISQLSDICAYLDLCIDQHLQIFTAHTDLKSLYGEELRKITQLEIINRFSLKHELFENVLKDAGTLQSLNNFLFPLFSKPIAKTYNINKAVTYNMKTVQEDDEITHAELDMEEIERLEEQKLEEYKKRLELYKKSLIVLLNKIDGTTHLSEIELTKEEQDTLIPAVTIFKEIMITLLKQEMIDMNEVNRTMDEYASSLQLHFNLYQMLQEIFDESPELRFTKLIVIPDENAPTISYLDVYDDYDQTYKEVRCSDIIFKVERGEPYES